MSPAKNPIERLEATHRQLKAMRRRFQRSTWITAIIGFGLLALVAGYFAYGYTEISDFRNPDLLVALVGDAVDQAIPEIRRTVEAEVNNNAPVWAEQVSQQVVATIPTGRQKLEDYACEQADTIIEQLDVMGEKEFRRLLAENRPAVEEAIRQLKEDQELSDDIVLALEAALEKELKIGMEDQAALLLAVIKELNKKMKALQAGEDLDEEQQAERRALMLARRMQVERFGDVGLEDLAPQAVTDAVQELERARLGGQAVRAKGTQAEVAGDVPKVVPPTVQEAEPAEADEPKPDEPKADEPKADEPKADKPKPDKPKPDEPKADEPKADEPKADEPKPDKPKADEPKADEPKADEPKADEPKADEPKAEEAEADKPKAGQTETEADTAAAPAP